MSTRSIILVTGSGSHNNAETVRLYKHTDGYPTGNLPLIKTALEIAEKQVREHKTSFSANKDTLSVMHVVGKIIGESTGVYGMGAKVDSYEADEAEYREVLKPEHFGNQTDLEWIYVVNVNAKTVSIYGGGYTHNGPQAMVKKGTVNPQIYAEQLRDEYQASERAATIEAVKELEAIGYAINPQKGKRAKKVKVA